MYQLLIVDDDELLIEEMMVLMDWNSIGIAEPLRAYSVEEAKRLFQKHSIDLLLSDVEMMGNDGFDLLSWVQENFPATRRGFLSCHARFDYAQRAMRLGAKGYLLKPVDKEQLKEFLESCIHDLQDKSKASEAGPKKKYSELLQTAIDYIEENLGEALSRDSISRELFVSETYLSKVFTKELGMTLSDYITNQRILRAQKLLKETDLSVTEISLKVGYNYPAYFSRIFKDRVGVNPNQYR